MILTEVCENMPLRYDGFGCQGFVYREPESTGTLPPNLRRPSAENFEQITSCLGVFYKENVIKKDIDMIIRIEVPLLDKYPTNGAM